MDTENLRCANCGGELHYVISYDGKTAELMCNDCGEVGAVIE